MIPMRPLELLRLNSQKLHSDERHRRRRQSQQYVRPDNVRQGHSGSLKSILFELVSLVRVSGPGLDGSAQGSEVTRLHAREEVRQVISANRAFYGFALLLRDPTGFPELFRQFTLVKEIKKPVLDTLAITAFGCI